MSVIDIRNLGGLYPSVAPRALPPDGAQKAINLNPGTVEFRPLGQDVVVATGLDNTNPKSIYRFDRLADGSLNTNESQNWRSSMEVVSLARQQLNDDVSGRIFYTNDTNDTGTSPQGLRWHNAAGVDREAKVPPPTTTPTVVLNEVYSFTQARRDAEISAAIVQAQTAVTSVGFAPTYVGLGDDVDLEGWILRGDIAGVDLDKQTLRVFAVNPTTNAIIDTYSNLPPEEAGWVLDPVLGGYYGTLGVGATLPGWATGHSKWWCIPMTAYAQVYDVQPFPLKAALMAIDKPGTQGTEKLLTDAQAQAFVDKFATLADKDADNIKPLIDALKAKQQDIVELFNQGGKPTLLTAVANFYAQADVVNAIESAKTAFAEAIWVHVRTIGTATGGYLSNL